MDSYLEPHFMRNTVYNLFKFLFFFFIFQTSIYANSLHPDNKKIIENFRGQYISKLNTNLQLDEDFINDKNKIRNELIRMADIDQKVRTDVWQQVAHVCTKYEIDCTNDYNEVDALVREIDEANLAKLKLFMRKYTWFKISEFGKDGAQAAWLIVHHSSDTDLNARVLFIMQQLLESHEVEPQNYALMYDRLALEYKHFGLKQRYGSQFSFSEDRKQLIFEPCEGNIEQIETLRKKFGLIPLKENAKILAQMNAITEVVGLDLK